ncbi:MAG TPA: efflux RND transporter periplasmic adaptor subunit [Pseudomonadales bacterium]
MLNKLLRIALPLLILATAIAVAMTLRSMDKPAQKRPAAVNLPGVSTLTARAEDIRFSLPARGMVSARRQTQLSSDITGIASRIYPVFANGAVIARGEPLLAIDDSHYRLAVDQALAAQLEARLDLEDKQARFADDTLILKQARARFAAADSALEKARQDLAKTVIRAPYNAVIRNKAIDQGQYLAPGSTIATLYGIDQAEVRLSVTPDDILLIAPQLFDRLQLDNRITLTASIGGKPQQRTADRARLEGALDTVTRSYYITAELDDPLALQSDLAPLPLGTFVSADIEAQPVSRAFRLPLSVIHNNNHVWLLDNGRLKKQPVVILYREAQHVIVSAGLADGDQVVNSRLDIMIDGMPVNAVQP